MADNILTVKKLKKSYDGKPVVKAISFEVKKGEIFGILGPNGAGKTTTLEMIEAMRPIDAGKVVLGRVDVSRNPYQTRELIGIQPQSPVFESKTTLSELLRFFAATYGKKIDPLTHLKTVQLEDKADVYSETLSGGQLQRFSVAVALVHDPLLLFLDEPTTGLDPQARRNLWEVVRQVRDRGVTVIMTTHYMDEAQLLCDRVAIMDMGNIIAIDSPTKLVKQLLKRGFTKPQLAQAANLEDVFIDLTGKALRD